MQRSWVERIGIGIAVLVIAGPASPIASAGPEKGDFAYDPPAWLQEGFALIEARGASCTTVAETSYTNPSDPALGEGREQRGRECRHRVPSKVWALLKGDPAYPDELCEGHAWDVVGTPSGMAPPSAEEESYRCSIVADPGTEAAPNLATWRCLRLQYRSRDQGARTEAGWTAERTAVFPKAEFATLARCTAPRVRIERASGAGKVRATCSHACRLVLSLTPRGSRRSVGRAVQQLATGERTDVPLAVASTAPRALTLRVRVTAAGERRTARVKARRAGGRLRLPPTVLSFGAT
ncbi:MAG: hypothetical protein ACRDK0_06540 [Solirubrobacteraceae bacterium]